MLWVFMGTFVVLGGVAGVFLKKPHSQHGSQVDKLRAAYTASSPTPSASLAAMAEPAGIPSATASGLVVNPSPAPLLAPSPVSLVEVHAEASGAPLVRVTAEPSLVPAAPANVAASTVLAGETPVVVLPAPTSSPAAAAATSSPNATSASDAKVADANQEEVFNPEDPLNSGLKLKPDEIKYKVVFKATESAWVRYKVDHRPLTQFVFRMGKTLVLRAKEVIRFQVSPPKALTFSYRGSGFKPVLGAEHLQTRQDDATLVFPYELTDNTEELFAGQKPLSTLAVPAPRPTPSSAPSAP